MNKEKLKIRFSELKDYLTLFIFGISGAIPLSLISSTLKVFLNEQGFSLELIGALSLLTLPYSLKFLFAPFIDSLSIPWLSRKIGQRKSWIVCSQILIIIFITLLGTFGTSQSLSIICFLALGLAFASACQDVVIDGYRIELVSHERQALITSFYIYGYRIGLLISGGLALFLADHLAWQVVYWVMALFMAICLAATLFVKESRNNWQEKKRGFFIWFHDFVISPFADFAKKPKWLIILAFIASFKLADGFAGNLTAVFLREIGFSKTELATIFKTFGLFATMTGAVLGGIAVKKIGLSKCLWITIIMQGLSNLNFSLQALIGHDVTFLYWVILVENLSGGIGDAVFVAYLSGLCNRNFSATQYALFSSFASSSRSFFSASAGVYAQTLGWYNFFLLTAILALPTLVLMSLIHRNTQKPSKSRLKSDA